MWKIWIDTGGTFTDCIAYDPENQPIRLKILSSGCIRGKIQEVVDPYCISFFHTWPVTLDIFTNFYFKLTDYQAFKTKVKHIDFEKNRLYVKERLPDQLSAGDFEISSGEKAPILAARLASKTPLSALLPEMEMRLGSTVGTNALLERKGAKCALITTTGFKDLLQIGTQQRPNIFALNIVKPEPFYHRVFEITERLNKNGDVLHKIAWQELDHIIDDLKKEGIASVAIAFMHSYLNPSNELAIAKRLHAAGIEYVSCSHALAPVIKILPRAQTSVVNAYLSPLIQQYIQGVKAKISKGRLRIMTSGGGLVASEQYTPKDSLFSGPAGGVVGAASIGKMMQENKLIAFDMGGTSTDVSRYHHGFDYSYETSVGDASLLSPALSIETVAAGGGSVCKYDGYKFSVGPESAGANPGPACYGGGGPLTITDVNLLLGRIDPDNFGIPLQITHAEKKFREIMNQFSKGQREETDYLVGFLRIANEKMAETIRKISVRKGYDPSEYALLSFGGAGGQHACDIAELLNMHKVIIPYDASILSAYGMGQALIERFVIKQVLKPYQQVANDIKKMVDAISADAIAKLEKEGFTNDQVQINRITTFLRFQGQDHTLEVNDVENILENFKEQYISLFGHWFDDRIIELESIRVIASNKPKAQKQSKKQFQPYHPRSESKREVFFADGWKKIPVYKWSQLNPGAHIKGPALVYSPFTTVVVKSGWELQMDASYNTILMQYAHKNQVTQATEAVELELFTNRFKAIAEEMGALLERTAFSVNIKERKDFSCAILDPNGELVVNAPHIPVHLGSLGICVRSVKKIMDIAQGDIIITNHPVFGGSHLPDITLISGVFTDDNQLIAYLANRSHHAELGGKTPGSMPPDATKLIEEGVLIEPTYLAKNGNLNWQNIEKILTTARYPTRSLSENLADLNAGIASLKFGEKAMRQLFLNHGIRKLHHFMDKLKDYTHHIAQECLLPFHGKHVGEEMLDDQSKISAAIDIRDQQISIDFTGTSKTHPGNLNATYAITQSAIIYILRLLITHHPQYGQKDIPLNEGIMKVVKINLPECMLNPEFSDSPENCPAVVGGNTETSQRLVDTLLKPFGIVACSQGTMNNVLFGNKHFGYYETLGGGAGAGDGFHGANSIHQHMTNTKITDPEIMEFRYPVRIDRFGIRPHSGGKGKWNGGDGIVRALTFLESVDFTILSQHRIHPPYGLMGAMAGKVGIQKIIRKNGKEESLKGIDGKKLLPGDKIVVETPGGGGFGTQ